MGKIECENFELLMALQIEGDLPAYQLGILEEHIASCSNCRVFSEEMKESQKAVKAYAASDIDYGILAQVRISVMEQISANQVTFWQRIFHSFWWRLSFASLLLIMSMPLLYRLYVTDDSGRISLIKKDSILQTSIENTKSIKEIDNRNEAKVEKLLVRHKKMTVRAKNHRTVFHKQALKLKSLPVSSTLTKIEIQTEDPNIRIIWFTDRSDEKS